MHDSDRTRRNPTPLPAPVESGARYVTGSHRTAGWTTVAEIRCPRGHKIKDGFIIPTDTTLRCSRCGVLLYAVFVARAALVFVAEVDIEDVRAIKLHSSLLETMAYLGQPILRL